MSRLIRHAYKSVAYGLRYHTINQRLQKSAQKFDAHYDELSKVRAEVKKSTCPKKQEEALQVLEMGNESGASLCKLVDDYKHFKLHEEPNLIASNMLRDFVLPCSAGAGLAFVLGEIAYEKKIKEDCQAIERELSTLEREQSAGLSAIERGLSALKNELSAESAN
ncbi:hypothetical protein MKX03_021442 [Papaver bracteatum]|nr:hypothetical protein MKX03_021442 [Papaver bracteatum]